MIAQIGIALFGLTAIWLSQSPHLPHQRYACVFGLCAQPFWFYAAWTAGQWGVFVLCIFYTFAWVRGVKIHWSKRPC